jgi:hypothetical protein
MRGEVDMKRGKSFVSSVVLMVLVASVALAPQQPKRLLEAYEFIVTEPQRGDGSLGARRNEGPVSSPPFQIHLPLRFDDRARHV